MTHVLPMTFRIGDARLPKRIWNKIDITPQGCWQWTGRTSPKGYGATSFGGRTVQAHRATYELLVGPILEGLEIDHLCRNPGCVNPDHLEPVTQAENMRRRRASHCERGHEMTPDNTFQRGHRCRTCIRRAGRARYARRP